MKLLSLIGIIILTGCAVFNTREKVRHNFPAGIKEQCKTAMQEAKLRLVAKGFTVKARCGCTVHGVPGERKFRGVWAWKPVNKWVTGGCSGKDVWIAVDPRTGQAHLETLIHEFGHHWLMSNHRIWDHDPRLDDVFFNWARSRKLDDGPFKKVVGVTWDYVE